MNRQDYDVLNQKYSLGQLRNIPEYRALIGCDAKLKDDIQNALFYLLDMIDIDKCEGVWLELLANLVGVSRNFFDTSIYFKVNAEDVNVPKYIWFSQADSETNVEQGSFTDTELRKRIKSKIGANTSRCTREENIEIIKNMFFADSVKITNVSPMMLDIEITGENLSVSQTPRADIEAILGNGVGINDLIIGE